GLRVVVVKAERGASEPLEGLHAACNDGRSTVDMHWYTTKCRALDDLAQKYAAKCREYDLLLARYKQLQSKPQDQRAAQPTSMTARQNGPGKIYTFDDFDEMERRMCPQYSGGRAKRTYAGLLVSPGRVGPAPAPAPAVARPSVENVTPTKRARKGPSGIGKLNLLSSPPLASSRVFGPGATSPPVSRAATTAATAATVATATVRKDLAVGTKYSSQETQLDFSEADLPSDIGVELCPATDDEGDRGGTQAARERSVELQRILDAVGDCAECRAFYSTPGLVLPKRDPSLLCMHRSSRAKGKVNMVLAPATPTAGAGAGASAPPAPRSEQRPGTPENFWDIDYFPAIRTAGPEVLRKRNR
ncbi:hypothetical protein LPJ61_006037, partial [Coemansia biformis]